MTDNYDPNSHEEGISADHDPAAAEAEVWHGDQPPVDDFADQASEETATVSEETEVHADSETAETQTKKTSLFLPIAAGIGGVLLLGAVIYWQFGSSSNAPAAVTPMSTIQAMKPVSSQPAMAANSPASTPIPDVAPTTGMAPVADAVSSSAMTVANSPVGVATPGTTGPVTVPAPAPALAPVPAVSPAPTSAVSSLPMPSAPVAAPVEAVPASPMPVPVPSASVAAAPKSSVSANQGSALDERMTALAGRVEALQSTLDQTAQQLSHVANMVAANQIVPAPPNPMIEDRLTKLEQQLTQLQHAAPPAISPPPVATQETMNAFPSEESMPPVAARKATVTHTTRHKQHKAAKPAVHMASRHMKAKVTPVSTRWVLRAATPTEAWVAVNSTTPNLRHIQVGDELPGVGQIRAIHQNGDNWVIEGSRGTVQ